MAHETAAGGVPAVAEPAPRRFWTVVLTFGLLVLGLLTSAYCRGLVDSPGEISCKGRMAGSLVCSSTRQTFVTWVPPLVSLVSVVIALGGTVWRPRYRGTWFLVGYALPLVTAFIAFWLVVPANALGLGQGSAPALG